MISQNPQQDCSTSALGDIRRPSSPPFSRGPEKDAEQFRELMAHLEQVFWIRNATDNSMIYVSPAYEKIWGRPLETLYNNSHTLLDSVHPEDHDRVAEAMARKYENEGYEEEYRIVRPDGTTRWIWARSYLVRDQQGAIGRFAGIAEDITERKWAEKERARLVAIIEYCEDAVISKTTSGVIVGWNRGAERQYGYTAEEMMGRSASLLVFPEHYQDYQQLIKRVLKGESVPVYETVRRRKDGTSFNVALKVVPIEARDGEIVGVSNVGEDITRIKKLEAQFIEAQKMEVVGQLAGGVAHDFNNLLTVILGYSDMMVHQLENTHPLFGPAREIRQAAERANQLTRQLLVFSRKQTVKSVVIDLNEVLQSVETMLRQLIDENIELSITRENNLGLIKADSGYVAQILMNLAINARDAMETGGKLFISTSNVNPTESQFLKEQNLPEESYVKLSVSDSGTGMTDEVKARLFEPFFTTKSKERGTGLGLSTCQTIVKELSGHIRVVSQMGKGSTFNIYFPRVNEKLAEAVACEKPSVRPASTETILVVEDDPSVRRLLCRMLEAQGHHVLSAANGREGLRVIRNNKGPAVRLVITDVIMPEMDGEMMAKDLSATHPDVKVLYTSGYTDEAILRHGVLAEGCSFLAKPYTPASITAKVREILDEV